MHLSIQSAYYDFLNRFSHSYTRRILMEAINLLVELWPYLIAGILITSLIKLFLSKNQVVVFFQHKKNLAVITSALLGVISPLGSYIVIPLAAALYTLGTPLPVLMAFLMSSPLIDPNLFILTAGAFGLEMAVVRTISAYLLGVGSGYLIQFLMNKNIIKQNEIINENNKKAISILNSSEAIPTIKLFSIEIWKMTKYISKYFFLALILAAMIKILTPVDFLSGLFSNNSFISVLISAGAGVPFYVCGGAAIPVVQQLSELGMSNGAVLAFFISGPITKISNLVLMQSAFNTRVFVFYILAGMLAAIFFGTAYNIYDNFVKIY